jgi:hypothetical protein
MAVLIPDVPKECPNSERYVYERLGRELPDNWIVLHSLGLPGHAEKIWGEADIVILSHLGVFALEVKGGTVSCQDGIWTFGGDFQSYKKKEDPWTQAKGSMMAVRERLRAEDPAFHGVLFGFGVVMPFTTFITTGIEIIPEVLSDKRDFRQNLSIYISRLAKYWNQVSFEKHERAYRGLTDEELRRARQLLRPNLETALSLGGYLTGVDSRLVQLSNEQIRASRRMAANPRTVVRGSAGTGKSVIALERALQHSSAGLKVLYLCYNQLLAAHVRAGVASDPRATGLDVRHVHALYRELIERAGLLSRLQAEDHEHADFFSRRFPELAADALCEKAHEGWDVLVIDEAQDLLTPEHLDTFDLMLRDGLNKGRWHLFLDPLQNIYGTDIQTQVESRLATGAPAFDDLSENCRNTLQVAVQASIISGIDLAVAGAPNGVPCDNIYYTNNEDFITLLNTTIYRLLKSDVKYSDIAILSTRRRENSLIAGVDEIAGHQLADPNDESALRRGALLFTTMHAFKGLERQVVIAIDCAELGQPLWSMLHYAGLSRARCLLHVFLPQSVRKIHDRQAEAFGRRMPGRSK